MLAATLKFPTSYRADVHPVTGKREGTETREKERARREEEIRDISEELIKHANPRRERGIGDSGSGGYPLRVIISRRRHIAEISATAIAGAGIGAGIGALMGATAGFGVGAGPGAAVGGGLGFVGGLGVGIVLLRDEYAEAVAWDKRIGKELSTPEIRKIREQLLNVFEEDPILNSFVCPILMTLIEKPFYNPLDGKFYELESYKKALAKAPHDEMTGLPLCPYTKKPQDPAVLVENPFFHATICNRLVYLLSVDTRIKDLHPEVKNGLESIMRDTDAKRERHFDQLRAKLAREKAKRKITILDYSSQMLKLATQFYAINPPSE